MLWLNYVLLFLTYPILLIGESNIRLLCYRDILLLTLGHLCSTVIFLFLCPERDLNPHGIIPTTPSK